MLSRDCTLLFNPTLTSSCKALEQSKGLQPSWPNAQHKFCKALPVSNALQEAVEAEYSRLEAEGIVDKLEFIEWVTPMIHVPKSDGIRIPLPEDVFVKFRGGQRLTKLDLKSTY